MIVLTKLIAIMLVIYGCILIMKPDFLKSLLEYMNTGKHFYIAAVVRMAVGVFLMLAAALCRISWVILFFGAVSSFSGIICFVLKKSVIEGFIKWVEDRSCDFIHIAGIAVILSGTLIILAA